MRYTRTRLAPRYSAHPTPHALRHHSCLPMDVPPPLECRYSSVYNGMKRQILLHAFPNGNSTITLELRGEIWSQTVITATQNAENNYALSVTPGDTAVASPVCVPLAPNPQCYHLQWSLPMPYVPWILS